MSDMKGHIRGDGNGGLYISKPFALATIVLTLLLFFSSFVFGYATLKSKVDALEQHYDEAGPRHIETIKEINTKMAGFEYHVAKSETELSEIKSDVKEIKEDIKELLRNQ